MPISLAYSGDICWTCPVPRAARCQISRKPANSATDTIAARQGRDSVISPLPVLVLVDYAARQPSSRALLDLEAREIVLGLGGIESLAHHHEGLRRLLRRREADVGHELGGVGGEEDLLGSRIVVDIALDLTP